MRNPQHLSPMGAEYAEIGEIHRSNMSRVSFAEHQSHGLVIVKQSIDPENETLRARLAREAEVLSHLDHPQIPTVLEDGADHDFPYFVMAREFGTEGAPCLQDFPLPVLAARIVYSMLDPLGYVHENGLVHRDIKPRNLVVQWSGRTALIDFGIVIPSSVEEDVGDAANNGFTPEERLFQDGRLTHSDIVLGTASYMSPSRSAGEGASPSDDIYSAGITFYELLYGRLPFPTFKRTVSEIAQSHRDEAINFAAPRRRRVPEELKAVIERATRKDPEERYQTTAEMREDIQKYLRDNPKVRA